MPLEAIYKEVFSQEDPDLERIKSDILEKYQRSSKTFEEKGIEGEDLEYLRLFSWICELSLDVYVKKQVIEQLIDDLREDPSLKRKK